MKAAGEDLEALQNAEQALFRICRQEIGQADAHQAVIAWIDAAMAVNAQLFAADVTNTTGYRQRRDHPQSSGRGLLGIRFGWNARKHPKSQGEIVEVVASPVANLAPQRPQTVVRASLPPHTGTVGQQIKWVPFNRLVQPNDTNADPRAEQKQAYRDCLEGRSVPETVHAMSDFLRQEVTRP
jgi:hypothetical protein